MDLADPSTLLAEDLAAQTYADIWVVFPDVTAAPLLAEARRLADSLGCYVYAVVADESLSGEAIACGADRVQIAADAADFLAEQHPEFAFFPVSQPTQAAQLAQQWRAGLVTDARGLSISVDSPRALLGSHPVYGGEYLLDVAVTSPVKMATLDPRFLPQPFADPSRTGEIIPALAPTSRTAIPQASSLRDLGPVEYAPPAWRPLSKARVVVSAGRGVKDAEGFELVKRLAEKLGAEVAGDRSARDSGWVDEAHEVGVTGQEVAPDVYVAVGILGDTVHNAAITGARKVVAIHSNPDAPIFTAADLAAVADPKALLPKLIAALT